MVYYADERYPRKRLKLWDQNPALRRDSPPASMEDFNSETDSDYTSYWRDWVSWCWFLCSVCFLLSFYMSCSVCWKNGAAVAFAGLFLHYGCECRKENRSSRAYERPDELETQPILPGSLHPTSSKDQISAWTMNSMISIRTASSQHQNYGSRRARWKGTEREDLDGIFLFISMPG